jgi:hypothetical protein
MKAQNVPQENKIIINIKKSDKSQKKSGWFKNDKVKKIGGAKLCSKFYCYQ